jgi:hypothetical protein
MLGRAENFFTVHNDKGRLHILDVLICTELPPGRAQSFISLLRGIHEVTPVLASDIMNYALVRAPGYPHDAAEESR